MIIETRRYRKGTKTENCTLCRSGQKGTWPYKETTWLCNIDDGIGHGRACRTGKTMTCDEFREKP